LSVFILLVIPCKGPMEISSSDEARGAPGVNAKRLRKLGQHRDSTGLGSLNPIQQEPLSLFSLVLSPQLPQLPLQGTHHKRRFVDLQRLLQHTWPLVPIQVLRVFCQPVSFTTFLPRPRPASQASDRGRSVSFSLNNFVTWKRPPSAREETSFPPTGAPAAVDGHRLDPSPGNSHTLPERPKRLFCLPVSQENHTPRLQVQNDHQVLPTTRNPDLANGDPLQVAQTRPAVFPSQPSYWMSWVVIRAERSATSRSNARVYDRRRFVKNGRKKQPTHTARLTLQSSPLHFTEGRLLPDRQASSTPHPFAGTTNPPRTARDSSLECKSHDTIIAYTFCLFL